MSPNPYYGGVDADSTALQVPLASLSPYHRNPRRGNVEAIAASLERNGGYKPITVNRGTLTGRPNEILAGNHTSAAALRLGWATIAAVWVDVDDEAAARIVIADNRSSDLASYDTPELGALLATLDGDLQGTGFEVYDLDGITAALAAELEVPDALPTGPQPGLRSDRTRIITCPHCAQDFDATSAVEVRTPNNTGGRA